jgi:hypothetical protein
MSDVQSLVIPEIGRVYFHVQPYFLTISEELRSTYSFDAEGRLLSAFLQGINYKRGLDGTVLMKFFSEKRVKVRRRLEHNEQRRLLDDVRGRVERIRRALPPEEQPRMQPWLDAILGWDVGRLQAEAGRFNAIYKPISILPPDQYLSVVLQAAEGCSWNKCTFCTFYRDRVFRIKSPDEFRQHARQVKQLLGGAIGLRKSIFLGDANALIIPQPRLIELLQVVHAEFPLDVTPAGTPSASGGRTLHGVYSFLDIFGAEKKTLDQYRELRSYGVRRIYIGLETGDDEVFRLLNKQGSPAECVEAVRTIKAAGIDVGIIVLAGAGGDHLSEQHVRHSVQAVAQMGLGTGDIIYISPLVSTENDAYTQRVRESGGRLLAASEVMEQVQRFKQALRQVAPAGFKVTLYHIDESLY